MVKIISNLQFETFDITRVYEIYKFHTEITNSHILTIDGNNCSYIMKNGEFKIYIPKKENDIVRISLHKNGN